ncbi:MAG TPA: type II toxin-antitoxin system PemK/MazF family toxin [Caulobacteraceae bacterium]
MASFPDPVPGLVIGYAYLWRNEARQGRDEARKDRPCVIVLSVRRVGGETFVTVAPITHTPPQRPELAVELPPATKSRLRLDDQPSWIVADDLNQFVWPGVDLRPVRRGSTTFAYGQLQANLFAKLRERVAVLARFGHLSVTPRSQ